MRGRLWDKRGAQNDGARRWNGSRVGRGGDWHLGARRWDRRSRRRRKRVGESLRDGDGRWFVVHGRGKRSVSEFEGRIVLCTSVPKFIKTGGGNVKDGVDCACVREVNVVCVFVA